MYVKYCDKYSLVFGVLIMVFFEYVGVFFNEGDVIGMINLEVMGLKFFNNNGFKVYDGIVLKKNFVDLILE